MPSWLFQGNPVLFDVDGYLKEHRERYWWTVRQLHLADHMRPGDPVFVWRADGTQPGTGGLVALGWIAGYPESRVDDAPERWHDPSAGHLSALRVPIVLSDIRTTIGEYMVRRTVVEADPRLAKLPITKFRSLTNYLVPESEFEVLEELWRARRRVLGIPINLVQGTEYSRSELHSQLGGQQQGGISTPSRCPVLMLFASRRGKEYGYRDGRNADGYFYYTGEGQFGDMTMTRGNAAIASHKQDGKSLLVFEHRGDSNAHTYLGEFEYVGHQTVRLQDTRGLERDGIVFRLREVEAEYQPSLPAQRDPSALGFLGRRDNAIRAARLTPGTRETRTQSLARSQVVRDYVLARANGFCEYCGAPAPFNTSTGPPYLEAHHIKELAKKGPDHPSSVIALCPNCHRRVHHGNDASQMTEKMTSLIASLEDAFEHGKGLVVTAAVLMNSVGMVWLGQRRSANMNGKWEFPGGKAQEGETLEACLLREIGEELGIGLRQVEPFALVDHSYPDVHIRLFVFIGPTGTAGVKMELRDHAKGRWYRLSDISRDALAEADRQVVARLEQRFLVGI